MQHQMCGKASERSGSFPLLLHMIHLYIKFYNVTQLENTLIKRDTDHSYRTEVALRFSRPGIICTM